VKRYVAEAGTPAVRRLFTRGVRLVTCRIAYAEGAAAMARRWREGLLSTAQRDHLIKALDKDLAEMVVLNVTRELLAPIPKIVKEAPVRGLDAIHLAAALRLARPTPAKLHFVCSDLRLGEAAQRVGLDWIDPTDPPRDPPKDTGAHRG